MPGLKSLEKFSDYVAGLIECWKSGITLYTRASGEIPVYSNPDKFENASFSLVWLIFDANGAFSHNGNVRLCGPGGTCKCRRQKRHESDSVDRKKVDTFSGRKRRFRNLSGI